MDAYADLRPRAVRASWTITAIPVDRPSVRGRRRRLRQRRQVVGARRINNR